MHGQTSTITSIDATLVSGGGWELDQRGARIWARKVSSIPRCHVFHTIAPPSARSPTFTFLSWTYLNLQVEADIRDVLQKQCAPEIKGSTGTYVSNTNSSLEYLATLRSCLYDPQDGEDLLPLHMNGSVCKSFTPRLLNGMTLFYFRWNGWDW